MNLIAVGHVTIDVKKEPYDFTEIISANFKIIYEKKTYKPRLYTKIIYLSIYNLFIINFIINFINN